MLLERAAPPESVTWLLTFVPGVSAAAGRQQTRPNSRIRIRRTAPPPGESPARKKVVSSERASLENTHGLRFDLRGTIYRETIAREFVSTRLDPFLELQS